MQVEIHCTSTVFVLQLPCPAISFTVEAPLADALDRYSEATNIPKTTISRIALTKFLNELEKSGARAMLQQVCKI